MHKFNGGQWWKIAYNLILIYSFFIFKITRKTVFNWISITFLLSQALHWIAVHYECLHNCTTATKNSMLDCLHCSSNSVVRQITACWQIDVNLQCLSSVCCNFLLKQKLVCIRVVFLSCLDIVNFIPWTALIPASSIKMEHYAYHKNFFPEHVWNFNKTTKIARTLRLNLSTLPSWFFNIQTPFVVFSTFTWALYNFVGNLFLSISYFAPPVCRKQCFKQGQKCVIF